MKSTTTTGINRSFPSFDYFLEKAATYKSILAKASR